MFARRLLLIAAGLLGLFVMLIIGAGLWLAVVDLRGLAEQRAGAALERQTSIGSLRIDWRNPLALELKDVRVANMPGGSEPDMMRFASVLAAIDLRSLLRGVMKFERLTLERPTILLERHEDGARNWRFPGGGGPPPNGGLAVVPKNRTQFPTLIDMAVSGGVLIYRSEGRRDIRLDFHNLTIRSTGDQAAVSLSLEGAYNGKPVRLAGKTESFARMRDATVPFGTEFTITTDAGLLGFKGTMAEPVDFEGVAGEMQINTANLDRFLDLFGLELPAAVPLRVGGAFRKQGDHWELTGVRGQLASDAFTGRFALDEAPRNQPDAIATALDFPRLDLGSLLKGQSRQGSAEAIELRPDEKPGATLDARLRARQFVYDKVRLNEFAAEIRTAPGEIAVHKVSFGVAGGTFEASGLSRAVPSGGRLLANGGLSGADIGEVLQLLGAEDVPIAGRSELGFALDLTGTTLKDAISRGSRGEMVVAMTGGQVARSLIEKASVDLKALLRQSTEWLPVTCLLGVVDMRNGFTKLSPVRLRTTGTTLVAAGLVDVPTARLNLVMRAESEAANALALKLPIKIAGDLTNPSVGPAFGSTVAWLDEMRRPDPESWVSAELRALALRNPCWR